MKTSQQRLQIFIYFLDYCFPYGVTGVAGTFEASDGGGGGSEDVLCSTDV